MLKQIFEANTSIGNDPKIENRWREKENQPDDLVELGKFPF